MSKRKNLIKKGLFYYPSEDFRKEALINSNSIYKKATEDPVLFWEKLAKELFWRKKWQKAFIHKPPFFKWFDKGKINITENALDKNLEKNKDKIALIFEPENEKEKERIFSYYQLYKEVNKAANALKKLGVKKGDRVGIYLPMIPEVAISMLACAKIGAIHVVVFSAFSPSALKVRLEDTKAKILITADGYYRRGKIIDLKKNADEGVLETKVEKIIVVKRARNKVSMTFLRDLWWDDLLNKEKDKCDSKAMNSEDTLFILYTSGSTGKPKGIVHTCAGYTVQAKFTSKWIFNLKDDDVFWSMADVGWITGHTYTIYGPLLSGSTFVMYEGTPDFPDSGRWCKIIEKYKVTAFYTSPTAIRMFEKNASEIVKKHKMETLRVLGSVGEPIDHSAWNWYLKEVGKGKCPLVDTWWQTETGGILITSLPGIGPFKPTFAGLPFPGIKTDILDDNGNSCLPEKQGNLVVLPPFAPGLLRGVYKDEKKYIDTYFNQYGKEIYFTSDKALRDKNGLIRIIGRADDVIKTAGHRLSTGEMESAISLHKDVVECAVVGIPDEIKGEMPVAFVVLKKERETSEIEKEIIFQIRKEIGPIATPKKIYIINDLPKTRSGKIMRRILRKLFSKEELGDLSTLANPESVNQIKKILDKQK
ncbi:MAG: acetate--CoA ligase [Candidatus Pacebacteria bacterium]|nr:acetate--CoA ligase [Candidatus Paceibacterota bacterium]